jgi:cobalt/nickel transport system permease protein
MIWMKRDAFIEATVVSFARALGRALISEEIARQRGLLQLLDPRVRVIGLFVLMLAVILSRKLSVVLVLFLAAVMIALFSSVSISTLAKRVWLLVLAFTGVIALPAIFVTPGNPLATFAGGSMHVTTQGLRAAAMLIARVETAVTFSTLLILCTPWTQVLKALRSFHLPEEAIVILAMTHRYIFLLVETASQMWDSRKSRTVGSLRGVEQRRIATRTAGVLLSRSIDLSNEVYLAMQSRGFRGDIFILTEFRMKSRDYVMLFAFLSVGIIAVWIGR